MSPTAVRAAGLAICLVYAGAIVRVYVRQPVSLPEVAGSLTSSVGAYRIDQARFDAGLAFFRADQFVEARDAFAQADPARQDATVQFYVAYSYYRQGWGRLSHDDALYDAGLAALRRAVAAAPDGRVVVSDPGLQLHTADELEVELRAGMTRDWSDLNPLRVLRERK